VEKLQEEKEVKIVVGLLKMHLMEQDYLGQIILIIFL
jgi:hypothetical protein